jgi:hypothetical protein
MVDDPCVSPYFRPKHRQVVTCSPYSESPYFVKSASSSWGSVESLGPLLFTLEGADVETLTTKCEKNPEACKVCTACIASATLHFICCPEFRDRWNQNRPGSSSWRVVDRDVHMQSPPSLDAPSYDKPPVGTAGNSNCCRCCWEIAEERLQYSARHLCRYRCYMRAYAPYRDWFALRKALIQEQTGASIDTLLTGWRCILLLQSPETAATVAGSSNSNYQGFETYLPRTAYVDAVGKVFMNSSAAMKHFRKVGQWKGSLESLRKRKRGIGSNLFPRAIAFESCVDTKNCTLRTKSPTFGRRLVTATPYGLLEELFDNDPWRLLLSTIFLNRTSRVQVDTVLLEFLKKWPTPWDVIAETNVEEISLLLRPMGMCHKRAAGVIRFSSDYLALLSRTNTVPEEQRTAGTICKNHDPGQHPWDAWTSDDIHGLFYCGEYSYAAFQLFIQRNWNIDPPDHALKAYAEFQRGKHCRNRLEEAAVQDYSIIT